MFLYRTAVERFRQYKYISIIFFIWVFFLNACKPKIEESHNTSKSSKINEINYEEVNDEYFDNQKFIEFKRIDDKASYSHYGEKNSGRAEYFRVELVEKNLFFKNLPKNFDGLRLAILTDLHIGYFEQQHLDRIYNAFFKKCKNSEPPADLFLFLGDLVNYDYYKEFDPNKIKWIKKLNKCSKYGLVLSILGNHDYNQYDEKRFLLTKKPDYKYDCCMKKFQEDVLGWKLLKNENIVLQKGEDQITIYGLEHLGTCTSITNRGNIKKTLKDLNTIYKIENDKIKEIPKSDYQQLNKNKKQFSIMMAHDPNYAGWLPGDLILCGHTHGSKALIDGIKDGSLSALFCENKYPSGLYCDKNKEQYLYVSKGVGLSGVDLNLFGKKINLIVKDRTKKNRIPEVTILKLNSLAKK